jgi:uncharacterized protein (UPF0332 family)
LHHDDLLRQAERLAKLDAKRPRQANLRRAVSSAYYALFHFLVDESCRIMMGTQHEQASYRHVLARAFTHATMKQACKSFAGGTLKAGAVHGLPKTFLIASATKQLAEAFVDLQEKRHTADYDLTTRFKRSDVLFRIELAQDVIKDFKALSSSNERRFFLACLWAWSALASR